MDRAKILTLIDVRLSRGLEIGALNRPIVRRDQGRIEYIDRTSTDELRKWYAINDQVSMAELVEVDHIWGSETLFECVGRQRAYDYIVASHVIEHVPDLFGWLNEIAAVLVDGGIASFVVPDKRFTFDVLRRTSSDSELVDAYVRGLRRPGPRQIFDHFTGIRQVNTDDVRSGRVSPCELPPQHQVAEILDLCQRIHVSGEYIDTHCWVFTPRTFVDALDLASRLHLMPFEIAALFPTAPGAFEFFVSLRRLPEGSSAGERRAAFTASRAHLNLPAEEDGIVPQGESLLDRLRNAERALEALHHSTSWRITAPLRQLVRRMRALKEKLRSCTLTRNGM